MRPFTINGEVWRPVMVSADDSRLTDRTGRACLATTDPDTRCVYLSRDLKGARLERVLMHEIGHCAMVSYGLLPALHSMVPPYYWVEVEEWICNFVADHGLEILQAARKSTGLLGRLK